MQNIEWVLGMERNEAGLFVLQGDGEVQLHHIGGVCVKRWPEKEAMLDDVLGWADGWCAGIRFEKVAPGALPWPPPPLPIYIVATDEGWEMAHNTRDAAVIMANRIGGGCRAADIYLFRATEVPFMVNKYSELEIQEV